MTKRNFEPEIKQTFSDLCELLARWLVRKTSNSSICANNNKSAIIKLFSFFVMKEFHPHMNLNRVKLFNTSTCWQTFWKKTFDIFKNMQTTWELIWKALVASQKSQSKQTNNCWKDISSGNADKIC